MYSVPDTWLYAITSFAGQAWRFASDGTGIAPLYATILIVEERWLCTPLHTA
jgi:hypothetical protein